MASSFNFTFPRPERSLPEALAATPRAFREQAKKGFKVLAGISKQHYAEILRAVVMTLESRQTPFEDLEKHLSLSREDVGSLIAAAMITVPILGNGGSAEEFTSAAVKIDMLPVDLVPEIRPFIQIVVSDRSQIARAIRRAAMPRQVFPFLMNVEIVVDLRMAFDEQKVGEAVPVALIHIDTDGDGEEIWFQASKPQLERLKNDVDATIKRMELSEEWARREPLS